MLEKENRWINRQTFNTLISGSIDGNADSATRLKTARKIAGVAFDGTAHINLPGVNLAGNQSTTGNAGTATKLAIARNINGVAFDGTKDIDLNLGLKLKAFGQYSPMNRIGVEFTAKDENTLSCYITRPDQGYYVQLGVTKMVLLHEHLTDVISGNYVRCRLAGVFPVTKITIDDSFNAFNGHWEIHYPRHGIAVGSRKWFYVMGLVYRETGMKTIGQVAEIDGLNHQMNIELDSPVSSPCAPVMVYAEAELNTYFGLPIQTYNRKNFANHRYGIIAHADFLDSSHIAVSVSDNSTDNIITTAIMTVMVYDF